MTKALVCAKCLDIRALDEQCGWTICRCGNSEARWLDPFAGTVRCRANVRDYVRILGLNNRYLMAAIDGLSHAEMVSAGGQWEAWRALHAKATKAPGYIFDEAKRACWACIIRVGETGDVTWEPEPPEAA